MWPDATPPQRTSTLNTRGHRTFELVSSWHFSSRAASWSRPIPARPVTSTEAGLPVSAHLAGAKSKRHPNQSAHHELVHIVANHNSTRAGRSQLPPLVLMMRLDHIVREYMATMTQAASASASASAATDSAASTGGKRRQEPGPPSSCSLKQAHKRMRRGYHGDGGWGASHTAQVSGRHSDRER